MVRLRRIDIFNLECAAGGGGGYGNPFLRDAQKVAHEVRNGVISLKQAKESYGVVIDPENYQMDIEATKRLRGKNKLRIDNKEDNKK